MDVAIRDAMVADAEGAERFGSFDRLRDLGVSSIEIEIDPSDRPVHLPGVAGGLRLCNPDDLRELKNRLDDAGVRPVALLLTTDFSRPGIFPAIDVGRVKCAVEAAAWLGAPVVRIDPLTHEKSLAPGEVRDNFIRWTASVLNDTTGSGVDLGMENHGPLANDPMFIDAVLAALPDARLGLTLDTGNFYWFGFPLDSVYELIEKYAPAAKHTHIKNINYPPDVARRRREVGYGYEQACCGVHEGNLDLRRVVRILRDGGYERDLCVEDESLFKHPPAQRLEVLRREVSALREALNGAAA